MAEASEDEWAALDAYEELCDDAYIDESESETKEDESEQDFRKPLQSLAASTTGAHSQVDLEVTQQGLEGEAIGQDTNLADKNEQATEVVFSGYALPKVPTRKSLTKQFKLASANVFYNKPGEEITLKRLMSRPPGTAFFGAKATIIKGWIQNAVGPKKRITFDSGSEITLINESLLKTLDPPPRVRIGQKLRLIQVTSNSSLSQYITVPLIFDTESGLVKMTVEAYVVPAMNTPFILGTDFAAQYQLSLVRNDEGTKIVFGDTGRSIPVEESDSMPRIDKQGNSFLVEVAQGYIQNGEKRAKYRKEYKKKIKDKKLPPDTVKVKIYQTVTIPAHSIKMVKVKTTWKEGQAEGYIDRAFNTHRSEEDIFAIADSVINRNNPKIQVSNLSDKPPRKKQKKSQPPERRS
ncbi:hypothetical protein RSOL_341640, partial [Rhizoctonia solani AG-3 Rhs1AP]